ncbi:alpha/beta hydrolase [Aspergillus aculeatinus CBS 121060]|uniref:Catalytic protein n=1 Tax=Aspergillus aculeatinus CBS 121060 TaxID=1448322 RepID=A0ACD1HCR8_9EURO|nr:catalytic protein [Aspergillus aculeatinus CBS 121060]RAH71186.1 catalytic protein [Aspergillus aculeatinus CBS 121060]
MNTSKPTIVLVQGSFQTSLVYEQLRTGLHNAGYPVVHPKLPSICTDIDDTEFLSRTLKDDADAVTTALQHLVEEEKKSVVVVMHSYGGIVGTEAIPKHLTHAARRTQGHQGGVLHLFYFAAFILPEGKSVLEVFGESPINDVQVCTPKTPGPFHLPGRQPLSFSLLFRSCDYVHHSSLTRSPYNLQPDGTSRLKTGAQTVYGDLPAAEAALWESRLVPQSYAVQTTCTTRAAYEYLPSTYLVCEGDQAVPPSFQEGFAGLARAEMDRCTAGHSPMLSQPAMLVGKIAAVVDQAGAAAAGSSL